MAAEEVKISVVAMTTNLWVFYMLAAVIGGLANSLVSNAGGWLKVYSTKEAVILGPLSDVIIGIGAGMGILWALAPQTTFQLIGIGAIAGFGGSSILRSLVNRIEVGRREEEATKASAALTQREQEGTQVIAQASAEVADLRSNLQEILDLVVPQLSDEVILTLRSRGLIA